MSKRQIFFAALITIFFFIGCNNPPSSPPGPGTNPPPKDNPNDNPDNDTPNEGASSTFTSLEINGNPYVHGTSAAVQLLAGEVFEIKVNLQNNGTTTWGRDTTAGMHGASLLSRGDPSHDINDYNETFGAFFIP